MYSLHISIGSMNEKSESKTFKSFMIDLILILNDHEKLGKQSECEDQNEKRKAGKQAESMFGHFYDCKAINKIQRNITVNKHAQRDKK